jgi:hypothetical protein
MFDTAFVTPKSKKARKQFSKVMENESQCFVEKVKENSVYLRSYNGKNVFWVNFTKDPDWELDF